MAKLIHIFSLTTRVLLLICINFCTWVQDLSAQNIKAELIGGINASQIDGDQDAGFRHIGFNGGFGAIIPLGERINASFEVLYTMKGASSHLRCDDSTCTSGYKFKMNMNYIEIPVMLNYVDKKSVSFGIGAAYARLLNQQYFENGYELSSAPDFNIKSSGMDILGIAEISYKMFGNFWINLRYQYSLTPFGSNPYSRFRSQGMFTNSVSIRFKFIFIPLGAKRVKENSDVSIKY